MKILLDENLSWTKYAISYEIKDASRSHKLEAAVVEVSRLKWLLPPNGALSASDKEKNFVSFLNTNFYKKNLNTQGKAQVVAVKDVQETEAEKVKNRSIETGEGSGENKKCMICTVLEMSILA